MGPKSPVEPELAPLELPFVEAWRLGMKLEMKDRPPWLDIVRDYGLDSAPAPLVTLCRTGVGECPSSWVKTMDGAFNLLASFVIAAQCVCNSEAILGCIITILSMAVL